MKRLLNRFPIPQGLMIGLMVIIFLIFSLSNEKDLKKNPSIPLTSYIEGVRIVHRVKGNAEWSLMAKRADFSRDEKLVMLNSIVIDIKQKNMNLSAEKGIFDLETKNLKLEDNIILKSDSYKVALKDLSWNPVKGILTSGQNIELKGNRFDIEANGLSATEEQKLRLHRNVRAIFF